MNARPIVRNNGPNTAMTSAGAVRSTRPATAVAVSVAAIVVASISQNCRSTAMSKTEAAEVGRDGKDHGSEEMDDDERRDAEDQDRDVAGAEDPLASWRDRERRQRRTRGPFGRERHDSQETHEQGKSHAESRHESDERLRFPPDKEGQHHSADSCDCECPSGTACVESASHLDEHQTDHTILPSYSVAVRMPGTRRAGCSRS